MKIVKITDKEICFDNGFSIIYEHEQNCCENVYAEFEVLNDYNISTITGKTIKMADIEFCEDIENYIQKIKGEGFNLISKIGEKFFIPCHNEQNGYYSSDLDLRIIKNNNIIVIIELNDAVKDDIF